MRRYYFRRQHGYFGWTAWVQSTIVGYLAQTLPLSRITSNMNDNLTILRNEFSAAEGSFLIQLRCELTWDRDAFMRLTTAMQTYCEESSHPDTLERWIAEGFWSTPSFVRDWATHASFPREHAEDYYAQAFERLDDLAYWYFLGESPYEGNARFEPL